MMRSLVLVLVGTLACTPGQKPDAGAEAPDAGASCSSRLGQGDGFILPVGRITFERDYWIEYLCDGMSVDPSGLDVVLTGADGGPIASTSSWENAFTWFAPFTRKVTITADIPRTRFVHFAVHVQPDAGVREHDIPVLAEPIAAPQWETRPDSCPIELPLGPGERVCLGGLRSRFEYDGGAFDFTGVVAATDEYVGFFGAEATYFSRQTHQRHTAPLGPGAVVRGAIRLGDDFLLLLAQDGETRLRRMSVLGFGSWVGAPLTLAPSVMAGDDAGVLLGGNGTMERRPLNALEQPGQIRVTVADATLYATPGRIWLKTNDAFTAYLPDGRVQRVPRPGFSSRDIESGPHGAAVALDLYGDVLDRRIGWVAEVQPDGGVSNRFISSPQTNSEFFTVAGDFVYQRTCVPDAQGRCGWRFDAARWR